MQPLPESPKALDKNSPVEPMAPGTLTSPADNREAVEKDAVPASLPSPRKLGWLRWGLLIGAFIAIAGTYRYWRPWVERLVPTTATAPPKRPQRPTPVSIAVAEQQDIDLYINAIGTVTAFNTVTIKSRVDGELKRVAFQEGEFVQQGDLLVELDARPFEALRDQVQGQLERDQAVLELARITVERFKTLVIRDATSQQELDEQTALYKQAEATLNVDRANLANAQLQVDYTRIVAPISGRIGLRIVDRGNIVKANDPTGLLVITQLQPISLVFAIPQDDIPRVQMQMKQNKELTVEAFDRDLTHQLATGKLSALDNQVDSTTGTLRMKATFANDDNLLFPNQFVNVRLKIETLTQALVVPSVAVQRGPKDKFVYVVGNEETVEVRTVHVGATEGRFTVIESGLEPGDRIVTEGTDKLQPGSKVSLPKSE